MVSVLRWYSGQCSCGTVLDVLALNGYSAFPVVVPTHWSVFVAIFLYIVNLSVIEHWLHCTANST